MLRLNKITKDYKVADTTVNALKGIEIAFRKNEFVSVLGPSGCGKTTLLNIVGGLDKYTKGDLFINGVSTKEFGDREWDIYRNHHIGFIFQSYNLIPHQSVLKNVELALTISGMSKEERVEKAKAALEKVGLKNEINKRPNQLSGGQSQRVAIARALVNDPDILLADEPTGALDTETSTQIMDLIQEIANDRLVIMVTHNPELADKYSTRIVRLLDGEVLSDTNPFSAEDEIAEMNAFKQAEAATKAAEDAAAGVVATDGKPQKGGKPSKIAAKKNKSKMSFFTAFKLSLNNLFSKRNRTIMTSIAGSIGIIGISVVLAFSYGIQGYITNMQNDMLSGNPITISQTTFDLGSMMSSSFSTTQEGIKNGSPDNWVNINSMIASLYKRSSIQVKNDIDENYVAFAQEAEARGIAASVDLDFGLDVTNNIYTDFKVGEHTTAQNMSLSTIRSIYTFLLEQEEAYSEFSDFVTGITNVFRPIPASNDYIMSQYKLVAGDVATEKDEIMIVLNNRRELTDLLLAQLGYLTQDEFISHAKKEVNDPEWEKTKDYIPEGLSFNDLMNKDNSFVWYPNNTVFNQVAGPLWSYNPTSNGFDDAGKVTLNVKGILIANENLSYGTLESGFYYTQAFRDHVIEQNKVSNIVKYWSEDFTYTNDDDKTIVGMTTLVNEMVPRYGFKLNGEMEPTEREDQDAQYEFTSNVLALTGYRTGYAGKTNMMGSLAGAFGMGGGSGEKTIMLTLQELCGGSLYGNQREFKILPTNISIYSNNFTEKQELLAYLDLWNGDKDISLADGSVLLAANRQEIKYSDNLSIIIEMINQFINIITVALVGFTSLALLVSCVMIGIITYVSVVERTKEIGVIRSLGGRKRDVGYLFNAETFILGLGSGLIGVGFTWILSFLVNIIVKPLIGMAIAVFPVKYALIMLLLSVGLTVIAGLIPSRSAAKKDPVVALRTE